MNAVSESRNLIALSATRRADGTVRFSEAPVVAWSVMAMSALPITMGQGASIVHAVALMLEDGRVFCPWLDKQWYESKQQWQHEWTESLVVVRREQDAED